MSQTIETIVGEDGVIMNRIQKGAGRPFLFVKQHHGNAASFAEFGNRSDYLEAFFRQHEQIARILERCSSAFHTRLGYCLEGVHTWDSGSLSALSPVTRHMLLNTEPVDLLGPLVRLLANGSSKAILQADNWIQTALNAAWKFGLRFPQETIDNCLINDFPSEEAMRESLQEVASCTGGVILNAVQENSAETQMVETIRLRYATMVRNLFSLRHPNILDGFQRRWKTLDAGIIVLGGKHSLTDTMDPDIEAIVHGKHLEAYAERILGDCDFVTIEPRAYKDLHTIMQAD